MTAPLRLAAVTRRPDTALAVANAALGLNLSLLPAGDAAHAADILVRETDLASARERADLARLAGVLPVIVVADAPPSLDEVRALLRLGIADCVPQPVRVPEMRAALMAAMARAGTGSLPARQGRVTAVLKAGGGAGATTLAVHVAAALARSAGAAGRVCLIDLDVQFGAVGFYLDVEGGAGVLDLARDPGRLDGELLRGLAVRRAGGVDVLTAPAEVMPLDLAAPDTMARVVTLAAGEYDHVVLDLPHVWTGWTHAVLSCCDTLLLVAGPSLAALRMARRQLDTLAAEGLAGVRVVPVINRAPGGWFAARRALREATAALGCPVTLAVGRDDAALARASDAGQTLFETGEARRLARQFTRVAEMASAKAEDQAC